MTAESFQPSLKLVVLLSLSVFPFGEHSSGKEGSPDPFVRWARETAVPIEAIEPGKGFADLQPLKATIGQARVVALGESSHGVHEFLAFRNRLFEFLVEEMGFTAIAVETGFAEGVEVDAYVVEGVGELPAVVPNVFCWANLELEENRQLINWMRRHNTSASNSRRLRFYGIDVTGGRRGEIRESRRAIELALTYLDLVDPESARHFRQRLASVKDKFSAVGYLTLSKSEQDGLTATISDLVSLFQRRRVDFLDLSTKSQYQIAYRHAIVVRQLDAMFRDDELARSKGCGGPAPEDSDERDVAMAENFRWVLEREGPQGRVFLFAHNDHVRKGPIWKKAYPEDNCPHRQQTAMGEYLDTVLGDEMVVFGTSFRNGDERLEFPPITPTSVDGALAKTGVPLFSIDLRLAPKVGAVMDWLNRPRQLRHGDRYCELNPIEAFDALVFIDTVTYFRLVR